MSRRAEPRQLWPRARRGVRAPAQGENAHAPNAPIADLPNELVADIADYLDLQNLRSLSLTSQFFVDFARPRLLSRINLSSARRVRSFIAWYQSKPLSMRNLVRQIRLEDIKFQTTADKIVQAHVACLLDIAPHIECLDLCGWSSCKVDRSVTASLGNLMGLQELHLYINLNYAAMQAPSNLLNELLRALPPNLRLRTLRLSLTAPAGNLTWSLDFTLTID